MSGEFDPDANAEANILNRLADSGNQNAFQDAARELLNHPEEFRAIQALQKQQQPGTEFLHGFELVGAQPGDGGSNKATGDYIRLNAPDHSSATVIGAHSTQVEQTPGDTIAVHKK
jgi:hypothetical protein